MTARSATQATGSTEALRILLVSDGRPGHFNLAVGICAALTRRIQADVSRIAISRPRLVPSRALSWLTNSGASGTAARFLGVDKAALPERCDLVVSAGGDTLAANIALARRYGCPNIFYGSLRRYRPEDFALVLTSYAAAADRPRHAMTLKPSVFDPDAGASAEARPVMGLLVGGDSGTVRFSDADWTDLASFVRATASSGRRLIVANSRRTPDTVSDTLAEIARQLGPAVQLIDVRSAGPGTLGALFHQSTQILVTTDSSSMVSEAVWSKRPVVALAPRRGGLPVLEEAYRAHLAANGWVATIPLSAVTLAAADAACASLTPLQGNPLDALADLILSRVPALAAQAT